MASKAKIELVVAADEPTLFYSSVQQAETHLEAIDVRNGVYPVAYGPAGQVFKLEAIGDRVRIAQVEGLSPKPDDLRALLLLYLSATGVYDVGEAETLVSLLARCEAAVN
ncbi:hypothetical protein QOZ96_001512 [Brevundimonas nasdae]|uniref:hypothetical protein n=1 Tax=Brevundimonas nasdae TaxID=172043 RepID=UPI0019115BF9|nr:hypothetical protein [Brevundimonas nasdae]MBK6025100.1 hypothetical protein [Brevundimonas nasdae]MDQ0451565.1 hypothetical protein [Brevundimonas nasdae]